MQTLSNDQLSELLPAHQTMKLQDGWTATVNYNYRTVKIGFQRKPYYNYFTVTECKTEQEARMKIYKHLKQKSLIL